MRTLYTLILSLAALSSHAYDFTSAGLNYTILSTTSKTVEVSGIDDETDPTPHIGLTDQTGTADSQRRQAPSRNYALTIPKTVTNAGETYTVVAIGATAFANNNDLSAVEIPSTVTTIGGNAFAGCRNLTSVTCAMPTPPVIIPNVFSGVDAARCRLSVPSVGYKRYKQADVWRDFSLQYNMEDFDVNKDGKVTIADVNAIVEHLLEEE